MGKHFWMKHLNDQSHDKQPGCMSGLVHVLDYHHWHSNVRKMIQHRTYEGETHDKDCDWSPETKSYHSQDDACDAEKLLEEKESQYLISSSCFQSAKRSRRSKRRSLKARLKGFIAEDISKGSGSPRGKQGFSFKSKLERTYSFHHLESLDNSDWKHPIIFFPRNVDETQTKAVSEEDPDVLEIFKVDKEFLMKHLQYADEAVTNLSRSALGLSTGKAKFSKSRSFPVAESSPGTKLKPIKLESKQSEVWSVPRQDTLQTVANKAPKLNDSGDESNGVLSEDTMIKELDENGIRKSNHQRSSSLTESLDKYARLFENSFRADAELIPSTSLKLTNEYVHAPMYFRRIRSLSLVDSYNFNSNFEVFGEDSSGNGSVVTERDSISGLHISDTENVQLSSNIQTKNNLEEEAYELTKSDPDKCLQETECNAVEFPISQGLEQESSIDELKSSNDLKSLESNLLSTSHSILNLEKDEISKKIIKCPKHNNPDLYYMRHLLEISGIEVDSAEMTWHASDQPLSPQLFEEMENRWAHEQDQLNGWPDFNDCWHHQMLFDLVNEVLVEVYDMSLPYYPKALSSSCYVRPFPVGNHITDDVITTVESLLNLNPDERESLDLIVGRDLSRDRIWMNLQVETECVALDIEDMIFSELLEEVILS